MNPGDASAAVEAAAPLNYFVHAAGPAAIPTLRLGWALAGMSVLVCVIVAGLLATAIFRRRPPVAPDAIPPDSGGMRAVTTGTVISAVVLLVALIYVMFTLETVASPARHPALTISVSARDWWWKVDYQDASDSQRNFTTANEIHIPVGEPVRIELHSADVIHAFWVPQLAGKTQTIPGQTNEQWIQADRAGIYRGQCTQFCGAQHAHMAFEVVAQDRATFEAWRSAQGQTAPALSGDPLQHQGQQLFIDRCAGCHTIRGTDARGVQAPDLTHLISRRELAAGALTNTPDHLRDWIEHAQTIKPDSLMPDIALNASEAAALSAYLATLR
nr:cytochrome c oxidase subunit II [Paraburkholderia saeva]